MVEASPVSAPACALGRFRPTRGDAAQRIEAVWSSPAVRRLETELQLASLTLNRAPILWKVLPGPFFRVMFPVDGGVLTEGTVVALACLYDVTNERTLYAHTMHAGPNVNPALKHLDGPMAQPKAQPDADGERATLRLMEHKKALWARFRSERDRIGAEEADSRWREAYHWSLKRLYFCSRCPQCKWGSPFFDGPDPNNPPAPTLRPDGAPEQVLSDEQRELVAAVRIDEAWTMEVAYAGRGGFSVAQTPRLIRDLAEGCVQLIFSTDAELIQGGTLVALSVVYHRPSRRVRLAHSLCAGGDPEVQFLHGRAAVALPPPRPRKEVEHARAEYVSWREKAWSDFWLTELTVGLPQASSRWLDSFWHALDTFFGGNDVRTGSSLDAE